MVTRMSRAAYIVDGIRSPFGRYGGGLGGVRADDLAASVIAALIARTKIPTDRVDVGYLGIVGRFIEPLSNYALTVPILQIGDFESALASHALGPAGAGSFFCADDAPSPSPLRQSIKLFKFGRNRYPPSA